MRRSISAAGLVVGLLCAAAAQGQTADEIVARNLEAKGGAGKLKAVESMKMTGRMTMQGKTLPLTIYSKRPNLNRQEMMVGNLRVVNAFDGTNAWTISPMTRMEPQALPPAASEIMKTSSEFDNALVDYKAKGHAVELVGTEKSGEAEVYHLKLTMKNGRVQHYYLDTKTGLEVRMAQEADEKGPGGPKQMLETLVSDYRPVDGIMMPHLVRQTVGTTVIGEMQIDKVEFNSIKDDSIFRMPAK